MSLGASSLPHLLIPIILSGLLAGFRSRPIVSKKEREMTCVNDVLVLGSGSNPTQQAATEPKSVQGINSRLQTI
jgi:hypothetical protein